MLHRDDRRASKQTLKHRSWIARSRQTKFSVEGLEERSLLSGAGVHASIVEVHNMLLAERAHRLQIRAEIVANRQEHTRAPLSTNTSMVQSSSVAPATHLGVRPTTSASPALQVQFKYQSATDLTADATIGFLAVGFSQDINLATLNRTNVQLSYMPFNAPSGTPWTPVTATLQYNAGNRAVVVTPGMFIYNGHVQPDGTYVLGIGTGLKSTSGASLTGPTYMGYTDHSSWGLPGHFPISYASLPGSKASSTNPNDPYTLRASSFVPGSGVIILDQYEQLDPSSVNQGTVQLFHVNSDGSFGARVPITMTYDNQIPSIYIVPNVALTVGNYRIAEFNTVNFSGNVQKVPAYLDFFVSQNDGPPGGNPGATPDVNWTFPSNNSVVTVTDFSSIGFNVALDPSTVNSNTIRLQKNVNGSWVRVPEAISYNAGTYVAYVTPTQGIQSQGSHYRLMVNVTPVLHPIKGKNGLSMTGSEFFNFTYNPPKAPFPPLIDAAHWESFPQPGTQLSFYPAAFQVTLNKWNGYQAGSINNKTFQIFAVDSSGRTIGGPINGNGLQVAWNPRSSYAIITLPNVALGDGRYVIVAHAANGTPGVGVVDLAGNVQKTAYSPLPFTITGTGRPQTVG